ncbi:MAG: alpha/beta hydrolase [Betaproteobacteria bacterium]
MPDVVARGVRFNVIRMGQGEPVLVLVHGLIMDSHASYYMSVAPALAKHASVILYDLRGHGRSEQPPSGYTTDDMVADLAAILEAVDLREHPVVIVGNSFGGHIALRFAVEHPARVRALVLLEAQSGVAEFGQEMAKLLAVEGVERDRKANEIFGRWLSLHAARRQLVDDPAAIGAHDARRAATIENVRQIKRRRRSPGVTTAEGLGNATTLVADLARAPAVTDEAIAGLRCPVLAIYGEDSELREDAERFRRLLPGMELKLVPGMGHTILLEATPQVRDAILDWLQRVVP